MVACYLYSESENQPSIAACNCHYAGQSCSFPILSSLPPADPAAYSSSILVRPLLQLLTTTTISWNKTEKMGFMILKVYMHIYIVLLIVYPQFGRQSLLAPLIMSGVVRVRV